MTSCHIVSNSHASRSHFVSQQPDYIWAWVSVSDIKLSPYQNVHLLLTLPSNTPITGRYVSLYCGFLKQICKLWWYALTLSWNSSCLLSSFPFQVSSTGQEINHCREITGDSEWRAQSSKSEHHTLAGKVPFKCKSSLWDRFLSILISFIQDELTTTKRSYEDQLSMMSDHLCSMNETLSKQREEIDTLKLGSKVPHRRISVLCLFFKNRL